jgi:dTDP-4-amino-4,6-dideoxy-D-galactose acyltransferase
MNALPRPAVCELLPWDSEFFGCRIARVCGNRLNESQAAAVEEWIRSERLDGLYFLADARSAETICTAENHGFRLVDIRMTLERRTVKDPPLTAIGTSTSFAIHPARPQDLPSLQVIAREAHTDTRFFSDPRIPRERAENLYSTWIGLECQGRAKRVLVATSTQDKVWGYLSCHLDATTGIGQIGLAAVDKDARGQGVGTWLVRSALTWFESQEAAAVTVVTQGKNIGAQRLYQSSGFFSREVQLWYHRWFNAPNRF